MGASVIAVTPLTPSVPEIRPVQTDVTLAAASLLNVPANLINAFLNMPAAHIAGVERFAAAMEASGSWNESHPNNVWGWDPVNPEHAKGMTDMFIPFPALSNPLGEHVNWWLAANLPMHEGCAFSCPDLAGMLNKMFKVPMWEFWDEDGYTFPVVINPVDGQETEWSEQQVILDPWEPVKSVAEYLLGDPGDVAFPTAYEVITAYANLASALQTTGHLPTWIAVREIETFFKLFVPKPDLPEESVETTVPESAVEEPASDAPESFSVQPSETARLVSLATPAVTDGAAEVTPAATPAPEESPEPVAEDEQEETQDAVDKPLTVREIQQRLADEALADQDTEDADETEDIDTEDIADSEIDDSDTEDGDTDTASVSDDDSDEGAAGDSGKPNAADKGDTGDKSDAGDKGSKGGGGADSD